MSNLKFCKDCEWYGGFFSEHCNKVIKEVNRPTEKGFRYALPFHDNWLNDCKYYEPRSFWLKRIWKLMLYMTRSQRWNLK